MKKILSIIILALCAGAGSAAGQKLSIAVFGGSLSVFPESQAAKDVWREQLGAEVIDYGVGGAGFAISQGHSLQKQVDAAGVHDIYILWASTNDFMHSKSCGDPMDYTAFDSYDSTKLDTQCGGINYCIKVLRGKNLDAKILFFTSLPFFKRPAGYESLPGTQVTAAGPDTNDTGLSFADYVDAQLICCALQDVPVLHQFALGLFNLQNQQIFYRSDRLHLKESGYTILGPIQADFIAAHQ